MPRGRPITSPTVAAEDLERLKESIQALGLSQADVARLTGFSKPTICLWFNGKARLSQERAQQIEEALLDYVNQTQTTVTLVKGNLQKTSWAATPDTEQMQSGKSDK